MTTYTKSPEKKALLLRVLPRTNLKEWKSYMEHHVLETLGDISQALKSGAHQIYPDPTPPARPRRIPGGIDPEAELAFLDATDAFEMTEKPMFKLQLESHFKKKQAYDESNKRLYAVVMLHLSDESRSRIEMRAEELRAISLITDGLELYKLVCETHVLSGGDRRSQVQTQIGLIARLEQKNLSIESFLSRCRIEFEYLRELDYEMTDLDQVSRVASGLNMKTYKPWLLEQHVRGTLPNDFISLSEALIGYSATCKSVEALYGGGKITPSETELNNVTVSSKPPTNSTHKKDSKSPTAPKANPRVSTPKKSTGSGGNTKPAGGPSCTYCASLKKPAGSHTIADCRRLQELISTQESANCAIAESGKSTEVVLVANSAHADQFLTLDTAATKTCINNSELLKGVRELSDPISVKGIAEKPLLVARGGELPNYGSALLDSRFSRNILAWKDVKHKVTWHQNEDQFHVHHQDGTLDIYAPDERGLYVHEVKSRASAHHSEQLYELSAMELKRIDDAQRLHEVLDHPSDAALITALDGGIYLECAITSQDVRAMRKHSGPCLRCLAAKMTEAPSPESSSPRAPNIGHTLYADIVFVRGVNGGKEPYLMTVEDNTSYIVVAKLPSKS